AQGEVDRPVHSCLIARADVMIETARDVRTEDPVLDEEILERERLEDQVSHMCVVRSEFWRAAILCARVRGNNTRFDYRRKNVKSPVIDRPRARSSHAPLS